MISKILLLGSANNPHMIKIANLLIKLKFEVHLVSLHSFSDELSNKIFRHPLPIKSKIGYLFNLISLKMLLSKINPDVLHIHYASGYGLLGILTRHNRIITSVWGSDIYEFPRKNFIYNLIIKHVLKHSTEIASTSVCMSNEIKKYTSSNKTIHITPFGINTDLFFNKNQNYNKKYITIGTVKSLEPIYCIDKLIDVFFLTQEKLKSKIILKLIIVGDGSERKKLEKKVQLLNLREQVIFIGRVPNFQIPKYLKNFDIFVALSKHESFGVSILEASSFGLPVVVSNILGFQEIVINNVTGYLVPQNNKMIVVQKLLNLINNPELRYQFGSNGRKFVESHFSLNKTENSLLDLYKNI